jgi:hypothetical protein
MTSQSHDTARSTAPSILADYAMPRNRPALVISRLFPSPHLRESHQNILTRWFQFFSLLGMANAF